MISLLDRLDAWFNPPPPPTPQPPPDLRLRRFDRIWSFTFEGPSITMIAGDSITFRWRERA